MDLKVTSKNSTHMQVIIFFVSECSAAISNSSPRPYFPVGGGGASSEYYAAILNLSLRSSKGPQKISWTIFQHRGALARDSTVIL